MLGFILSKMQMLLFAVGIAVVALLFYDFVSQIGLSEEANSLITTNAKLVSDQLNIEGFCSFDTSNIPDRLNYGLSDTPFFYDFEFSSTGFGSGDNKQNLLVLRVLEHNSNKNAPPSSRKVVAAKSVATDASIVLVDPGFIAEAQSLDNYYGKNLIDLYPRAVGKPDVVGSSPNGFVVLKEVKNGLKYLYIIPCASSYEHDNCLQNIVRIGCYKLKAAKDRGENITDSTPVDSCFNITVQPDQTVSVSKNFTWNSCKCIYPAITGEPGTNCAA